MTGNGISLDLDHGTAHLVEHLAQLWGVSKAEAIHRAVSQAETTARVASKQARLEAFKKLQTRLALTPIKAADWQATIREARRWGVMIHLDTNFLIQSLVPGSRAESQLQGWLAAGDELGMSVIAWSEFLCGPMTPQDEALAQIIIPAVEPFLAGDARKAAEMFNATGRRSRSLADCQIAAVALRCGVPIATENRSDFVPFQNYGLVLV
jgi:predicted nucleic acid-binding protein